jgi:lipoprotein NlpD
MRAGVWLVVMLLVGCASNQPAPVIERGAQPKKPASIPTKKIVPGEKDWRPDSYTVKKGDTLYSIGLEFGLDYKEIAQWNNLVPPYTIHIGRVLKFNLPKTAEAAPPSDAVVVTPMKSEPVIAKPIGEPPLKTEPKAIKEAYSEQAMATPKPQEKAEVRKPAAEAAKQPEPAKAETPVEKPTANGGDDESIDWAWPTQGKVSAGFNETGGSKGVDILGTQGQPVLAAAPGKVVYSGSGLRGYGKLVIIKHNKTYLSAYAHNSQILVKEGQDIAKGQKIAEMGNTDTDKAKLHFEIRKLGKPVDPAKYLPEKP